MEEHKTPTQRKRHVLLPSREAPRGWVDVTRLQRSLGMSRSYSQLGFQEGRFNTCKVGSGYSSQSNCRDRRLSVIHFRLQCRASTGTVESVSEYELEPLIARRLTFILGSQRGYTQTNQQGYGQVRVISPNSSYHQRLVIKKGPNALGVKASQAGRIVLPRDWCSI